MPFFVGNAGSSPALLHTPARTSRLMNIRTKIRNYFEAREFETRRRRIAKAAFTMKGPLAHFGAGFKVTAAYDSESQLAGNYISKQAELYKAAALQANPSQTPKPFSDAFKENPQIVSAAAKETVFWNAAAGISVAKQYDQSLHELGEYIAYMTNATWI